MATDRIVTLSDEFVLSSGTVCVDQARAKVLVLLHLHLGEHLLPKGRKQIGESLEEAAVRETQEESGFTCALLPHGLPTHANRFQSLSMADEEHNREDNVREASHTEPIAVQQRVLTGGLRKIIFWYLAEADSCRAEPVAATTTEEEPFEARWLSSENALKALSHADDREILLHALQALQKGR